MKKRVLLIAGGGTLGGYATMELLKRGYAVDVIALNECVSFNRNLTWIQKRVDDDLLAELFKAHRYDAIVDFIHYRDHEAYKPRCEMLLSNTDQLVFLSSYRWPSSPTTHHTPLTSTIPHSVHETPRQTPI